MGAHGAHPARIARRRGSALAAVSAALTLAAGCGDDAPEGEVVTPPPDSKTNYLDNPCSRPSAERLKRFHVTDEGFRPRKVVIRTGTPVAFINCGKKPHTVTKVSGRGPKFDSGTLQPRQKIDRTFAEIGTQRIVDRRNPGAEMIIRVTGLPGQPQN